MIPYFKSANFKCGCGDVVFYDKTLVKRVPKVCPRCKLDRVAKREVARREKLKAETAWMTGRDIERYVVMSHKEVGAKMGLSAESVRKIERSAMAKVRRAIELRNKQLSRQ